MTTPTICDKRRNFLKKSSLGLMIGSLSFPQLSNAIIAPQPSGCILDADYKFKNLLNLDLIKNYNYIDPFNSTTDSNIITTLNNYSNLLLQDKNKLDAFIERIKKLCVSMKESGILKGNGGFLGLPKGLTNNLTAEYINTQSFFSKKPIHPDFFENFEETIKRKTPSSATFSQYSNLLDYELSVNSQLNDLFNNANKHLEAIVINIQSPSITTPITKGFWRSLLSLVTIAVVGFVTAAILPAFAAALVTWATIGGVAWFNS